MLTEVEKNEYGKIQNSLEKTRKALLELMIREKDWYRGAELTKSLRSIEQTHRRLERLVENAGTD